MKKQKKLHEVTQPILTSEIIIMSGDHLLMYKRSEQKEKFSGFWSVPGGQIKEGE